MQTTLFSADFEKLEDIRRFIGQAAREAGLDESQVYEVVLAADEACSNIIEHAYRGVDDGKIECTCNISEGKLTVILRDHGHPFVMEDVPAPELGASLFERKIGGLGIFMMRRLVDEVDYHSSSEAGNVLTLIKHRRVDE